MIIGVMSDSHDNMDNVVKAFKVFRERGVKYIIHLGDIIAPFIVRRMISDSWEDLMVYAVYGNNDGDKYLLNKLFSQKGWRIMEPPALIELASRKILLLHGYDGPEFTRNLVYALAKNLGVDIILYGHTHEKDLRKVGDCLVLNPGEVYGGLSGEATIAILDLKELKAEFIRL